MRSTASSSRELIYLLEHQLDLKAAIWNPDGLGKSSCDLEEGEALLLLRKDGKVDVHSRFTRPLPEKLWEAVAKQPERNGHYVFSDRLMYLSIRNLSTGNYRHLVFARSLNDDFAQRLTPVTNSEVLIRDANRVYGSTFFDRSGKILRPNFPSHQTNALDIQNGNLWLTVPAYQGFLFNGRRIKRARENSLWVFHASAPLQDPDGKVIAYITTLVPMFALIQGPVIALMGTALVFLLSIFLGIYFTRRAADRIVTPLHRFISEILALSKQIEIKMDRNTKAIPVRMANQASRNEIRLLSQSLEQLKKTIERGEEAEKLLESEKARSAFSSRMATLGEMAAGIAHEINNPLATIKLLSEQLDELLAEKELDKTLVSKLTKQIAATSSRIARIVMGLRTFARDGQKDEFGSVNVKDLLADCLALCEERFKHHGVKLIREGNALDTAFQCRATQIAQVLLNLLNNAFDAVEGTPQPWIRIGCEEQPGFIEFSVVDSGPGVPESERERIFAPFFTTKPVGKGTGLGLSISKGIVESHGGQMYLDTQSKQTRFIVHLPKQQKREAA